VQKCPASATHFSIDPAARAGESGARAMKFNNLLRRKRPPYWLASALGTAAALLSACSTVPKLGQSELLRTPQTIAAQQSLQPQGTAQWPVEGWWKNYGDAQLEALIEQGLRNSPDIAVATARMRRAAAQAQEAGASLGPSLDASSSVGFEKQSHNNGFPEQFIALLPQGFQDRAQVGINLEFDLDLWGKNHAALAAATSDARAAAIEAAEARLLLATTIASAYADLARLFDARDVRENAVSIRIASEKLVTEREANGLDNRGSVRQAQAQTLAARSELAYADELITLRRHQLAALVGAGPDRGLAIARPALASTLPSGLPEGVTTDLIGRRPDIAAARERVEAAAKRVAVAKADFYPAVRLSAMAGLQAVGIGNLFENNSTFGSAGPAISLPLFHGGALRGRYRGAAALYDEAAASYNQVVIAAYNQVADSVTSKRVIAARLIGARKALAAGEEAYAIAKLRYEGGLSPYIDVLNIEDRLLSVRVALAELIAAARSTDIALIRALGGGYNSDVLVAKADPHE
jgi:NodT family efflux transporter outer membrane factor (OMF) lipoprotein